MRESQTRELRRLSVVGFNCGSGEVVFWNRFLPAMRASLDVCKDFDEEARVLPTSGRCQRSDGMHIERPAQMRFINDMTGGKSWFALLV